jgi:hypothetical protein
LPWFLGKVTIFLWFSYGVSMVFLWLTLVKSASSHGFPMVSPCPKNYLAILSARRRLEAPGAVKSASPVPLATLPKAKVRRCGS